MAHLGNLRWDDLRLFTSREANLYAACAHCRRRTTLDAEKLERYFLCMRWGTGIQHVYRRLYCIRCRRRPSRIGPCRKLPNAPRFFPETEEEWKMLVRRLRG